MPSYISSGRPSTDLTTVHPACSPSQRPSILGDSIKVFIHHDLIHWKYWKCKTIRSSGECCLRMELNMNMIDSPLKALKKMINIPIQIFTAYTQKWADFKKNVGKKKWRSIPASNLYCLQKRMYWVRKTLTNKTEYQFQPTWLCPPFLGQSLWSPRLLPAG